MSSLVPNGRETVTSVGSAWIICRSKSFAGRIYYFNTLTGEAVWNLSETEVEIAKRRTKILQRQPSFVIDNCPEPLELPQDSPTSNKLPSSNINQFSQRYMVPTKVSNKQVISNRFPATPHQYHRHNKYQHTSPKNCRVNKFQKINSKIDLRLLLSVKRRQHQLKEKVSQLNAAETNNNKYKQGVLDPLSTRIQRKSNYCLEPNEEEDIVNYDDYEHLNFTRRAKKRDGPHPSRIRRRSYSSNANEENNKNNDWLDHFTIKNSGTNQGAFSSLPKRRRRSISFSANEGENDEDNDWLEQSNNKYTDTNQGDFSQKPSSVRRRSFSFSANQKEETDEANEWLQHSNNKNSNQSDVSPLSTHRKSVSFKVNEKDSDSNVWLEAKLKTQRDINSSERKASTRLSQVKENTDVTFIVPDSNVFLKNINLLNDILNTDKKCCLLVPKMVMNKIQAATKLRCRALAYKALYFIWQQHEANFAIIEESEKNESNENDILNFCCQLIDQEIHVVLLTDDIELINSNNDLNINIRIITTVKMQQLVDEYKCNETKTNMDTEALADVKIIIENESNIQQNEEVIKSPMRKCIINKKSFDENQVENRCEGSAHNVFQKDKKACDVGVQASCNFPSVSSPSNTDVRDEVLLPDSTKANDNIPCKTGGIKLKRNFSTDSKKNTWNRYNTNLTFSLANGRIKAGNAAESTYPVTDSTVDNTLSDGKKLTWSLVFNTSTDSLYKINEGSDTSSIIFRNVNQRDNITIEDSNSVISNTRSNVDTESERGGVHKANTNIDDRIVMFEVSDSRMEEALRVKMDEWVSWFVHIMEEALNQLLQREPTFALEPMLPAWTVHEAAECVRKHFSRDLDVLTAAERLLAVSRDHGDLRGKIKSNISPHKYMELYSYGVYLIDALQGVFSSNEDLQTASEALSKLLNDIQQSHSDPGAQDCFKSAKKQEVLKRSPIIRNNKKQSPENRETSDNSVTFMRTIDPESSFFSDLKKISSSNNPTVTEKSQQIIGLGTSDNIQEKSPSLQNTNEHISSSGESIAPILNGETKMNEPKIIRNFFKCVEFEEKLKHKTGLLDNQDWTYDDEDDTEEGRLIIDEDFTENYKSNNFMDSDYVVTNYVEDLWCDGHNPGENDLGSLENSKALNTNHVDKTVTFKLLMGDLESGILKAYTSIRDFCVRSCETLQSEDLSPDDTSRILARAEKTSTYICEVCNQLESILRRENTQKSIFQILKRKEFADVVVVEDDDMEDYREYIGNCLEQGSILKESVKLVVRACQLKAA